MIASKWTTIGGVLTMVGAFGVGMTALALPGCEDMNNNDVGDDIGDAVDDAADGVGDAVDDARDTID